VAFKPIEILINAKDNASSVFGSLQTKVAAVGAAIATYFGVNAFVGIVSGAADLETAMSRVQAATGATGEEMQALRQAAEDAGANTKFTSTEAAGALENLAKAGLSATDSIAALPAVLNLAQAGDIGLAESSELVTKAVMGMGLAFTDAGRVADVLALGANATNTSVQGLAQALSYAAPVAQSLGLSLESTVAIIGKFADAGIDASRAGTALNSILSQFSNPASKFREELAAAGITTGNFETALHQLAAAGPAGSKAITAVGQEAGPALRALLNQGMGALDGLTEKLKTAEGSAAATAAVMQNNLNGALSGLSSAWDTVKNALGTPVLPVLQQGVEQLAGALKAAVADGTVGKFGEAIATAFQAGIKWVKEFIGTVDFTAVLVRLQEFADNAKQRFDEFGQYATSAGNIVKTAYGVMSAGANVVLVAIYGIGIAFAETSAGIVRASAFMSESLAKIAFGDAKDRLIREAAQMREVLAGLSGVSEEFGKKAKDALDGAADGAKTAGEGFSGLTNKVNGAKKALDDLKNGADESAKALDAGAAAAARYGVEYQKKIDAENAAAKAAEQHQQKIQLLQEAYEGFMRAGNVNEAIITFDELTKAQRQGALTAEEYAKKQKELAAAIEAAYKDLGITTDAELKKTADRAVANYELLKKSGTASARELAEGFEDAARKVIAANDGIAPSWVKAEAGVRGYKVAVDASGKAHLELVDKAVPGLDRMARGWHASREAIQAQQDAMDKLMMKYTMSADYTERQIKLLEREAAAAEKAAEAYRKKWNMDKEGYSLNTAGERVLGGESQEDIDKAIAELYGANNVDNADAQRARQLRALAQLRSKGNGLVTQPGLSADERRELQELEARILNGIGAGGSASANTGQGTTTRPEPTRTTGSSSGLGGATVVHLNFSGAPMGLVNTDAAGRATLENFMRALQDGRGTSR
jgi:TP901 family phage tail tape measure protein